MRLLTFIAIIIIILIIFRKKDIVEVKNENYNFAKSYILTQNRNGKLLVKNQIYVTVGDKTILLNNVEIDTGGTKLVLDRDSTREILNNKSKLTFWCSRGGWGDSCQPYSYTSNFSGKEIKSEFYNGNISFLDTNIDMGIGSSDREVKDYTILGMAHEYGNHSFNYLNELFKNQSNIPRKFTFKFNNLDNGEGGEFYFGDSKSPVVNYLNYITNDKNKYIIKVISISIDGKKIPMSKPYYASIDSGAENFTLPTYVWKGIGEPKYGKISIIFEDENGNRHILNNNTPIRNYDPGNITLENGLNIPYILIGKYLLQNSEVTFDIENKKIGFSYS